MTIWFDPPAAPRGRIRYGAMDPVQQGPHLTVRWASPEQALAGADPIDCHIHDAAGVTPSELNNFKWATWLRVATLQIEITDHFTVKTQHRLRNALSAAIGGPRVGIALRPGRAGHQPDHYQRIADRYLQLSAAGVRNPTTRIAADEYVSRNTASGWIRKCRELGMLPPAQRGKAG